MTHGQSPRRPSHGGAHGGHGAAKGGAPQHHQRRPSSGGSRSPSPSGNRRPSSGAAAGNKRETFACCDGKAYCEIHGVVRPDRSGKRRPRSGSNTPKGVQSFAIDKEVAYDVKADDIKRHSADDKLDLIQKAQLCLKTNEDNQICFVAANMHSLIIDNKDRFFKEVFPHFEKTLHGRKNVLMHEDAAKSAVKAIHELHGKDSKYVKMLMRMVYMNIDNNDKRISFNWATCLGYVLEFLTVKEIQNDVYPVVVEKSKSHHENARRGAVVAIARIAHRVPEQWFVQKVFPIVILICTKDHSPSIRFQMYKKIGEICEQHPSTKHDVEKIVHHAIKENDAGVKAGVVCAISNTIAQCGKRKDNAKFYSALLPYLKKLVKEGFMNGNTPLLVQFSADCAHVAYMLKDMNVLTNDDKLWFIDAFLHMTRYGVPRKKGSKAGPSGLVNFRQNLNVSRKQSLIESLVSSHTPKHHSKKRRVIPGHEEWRCRANCAKTFPEFLHFAKSYANFKEGIKPVIKELIHDPSHHVRAAMAGQLFAIMGMMGPHGALLHGEFVRACTDDNVTVLEAIAPQIGHILKVFTLSKVLSADKTTNATVEVGGALLHGEARLNKLNEWRVHTTFLGQFAALPFAFPNDYIYKNFLPVLFHRLGRLRPVPTRMAIGDAIMSLLRHCRRSKQRQEIRYKITHGLGKSRTSKHRMLFLYMMGVALDTYSRKYFRSHFFESTLALCSDRVPNCRIKVCHMLPEMRGTLRKGHDNSDKLLAKLYEAVKRLKHSAHDRDVVEALKYGINGIEANERQLKGLKKSKADIEDEAKEAEEEHIAKLEAGMPAYKSSKAGYHNSSGRKDSHRRESTKGGHGERRGSTPAGGGERRGSTKGDEKKKSSKGEGAQDVLAKVADAEKERKKSSQPGGSRKGSSTPGGERKGSSQPKAPAGGERRGSVKDGGGGGGARKASEAGRRGSTK